jgi:hypothetical protein
MKKIFGIVVVAVIVVIIIVVVFLLSNLNSLVAKAIEKNGSEVTQTKVGVSGVDISLREGRGSIKGLRVASPDGFRARNAFSLDDITVDIDIKSVREKPVVLDEVRIRAPVVYAELTKTGASNIDELRKRVREHTGGSKEESGEAVRIRITKFVFEKGRVEVDASALGLEKRTIDLPEIRLNDVGGANGAPPDQIATIILTAVAKKVTAEIAGSELDRLIKDKVGGSITDKAKGVLDKIGK